MRFNRSSSNDEKLSGFAFFDVAITLSAIMMSLFILVSLLPHKNSDESAKGGKICAELYWDNNRDIDLDLWGKSPVDIYPVGFSHMHDKGLDLFRDVIGFSNNPEHVNMEIMCTTGIYPGEYIFDSHYFSNHDTPPGAPPTDYFIKAKMIVRITQKDKTVFILTNEVNLDYVGKDKTMISFKIDENKEIIKSSVNSIDRNLVAHEKSGND